MEALVHVAFSIPTAAEINRIICIKQNKLVRGTGS
jgi:hypothetical protein